MQQYGSFEVFAFVNLTDVRRCKKVSLARDTGYVEDAKRALRGLQDQNPGLRIVVVFSTTISEP